jgi:hypothetical protein
LLQVIQVQVHGKRRHCERTRSDIPRRLENQGGGLIASLRSFLRGIHSFALCLYGEKILQDLEQNPSTTLITYFKLCPKEEVKQESVAVSSCQDVTRDEVEFSLQKAGQFLCYQRGFCLAAEHQRQEQHGDRNTMSHHKGVLKGHQGQKARSWGKTDTCQRQSSLDVSQIKLNSFPLTK